MKFHGTMMQDDKGLVHIGGVSVKTLKEVYGTPLYIYDETHLRNTISLFKKNFKHDKIKGEISYASKAFLTTAMAQLIQQEGLCIDVASQGELYTVYKAGFDMSKVHFHGNNKTDEELKLALELGCGNIILDNHQEYLRLSNLLKKRNQRIAVSLRVNPGIDVQTHDFIKTSKLDSKFGVSIEDKALMRTIYKDKNFIFKGLHAHIGSQIHQTEPFFENVRTLMSVYHELKEEGIHFTDINIGGGFGVYYTKQDDVMNLESFLKQLIQTVYDESQRYNLNLESVMIEPGRSIVNNAGSTLYTVGATKLTPSGKEYVFVDGGMSDNLRVALYDAQYDALIANHNDGEEKDYSIAGKLCESGDILSHKSRLKGVSVDDLLLMTSTGAYTYSMSSNYNKMMRPAVVFVKDKEHHLVVKRQSLDDLIQGDLNL